MNSPLLTPRTLALTSLAALLAAGIGGYYLADSKSPLANVVAAAGDTARGTTGAVPSGSKNVPLSTTPSAGKWTPPEGDPVERYLAGKTAQERYDVISNFMALGHDRNATMLIEGLKDTDLKVQIFALESSTALEAAKAHQVLTQGCVSPTKDVREMAWSLLAPYGINEKAQSFAQVLIQGPDAAFDEAFQEMSISPERPLFETMLNATQHADAKRQPRLLKEMQEWLERAGEVPKFKSATELVAWWGMNAKHYDQYLLRLD
jgi:hypothetical protein